MMLEALAFFLMRVSPFLSSEAWHDDPAWDFLFSIKNAFIVHNKNSFFVHENDAFRP
jgi:hypothetical protein